LANFKIDTRIPFCIQTDEIVDLDSCVQEQELLKKIVCAAEINELKANRDQNNNEFKYIYTLNDKKLFFFLNQNIYNTNCSKVDSFEIHDKIDSCTRDVLVSFKKDGISQNGYLTKEEIIRTDSVPTECKDEVFLPMDNNRFSLIRKDKNIEIVEQANKKPGITKIKIETEMSMESNSLLQKILTFYQKIEFSPFIQISKDLILSIVLIAIVIIMVIFCAKNKKKNLLRLIQGVLNVYLLKVKQRDEEAVEEETKKTINRYNKKPFTEVEDVILLDERSNRRNTRGSTIQHINNNNNNINNNKKSEEYLL